MKKENSACCPTFHLEKWNEKTHFWEHKKFIKAWVPTFFHIPLPPMIGNRITRLTKLARDANKLAADRENILVLFTAPHAFMSEIYLAVTDRIPKAKNRTLSGRFISKVFDGPYKDIAEFIKQMDVYLMGINETAKRYFIHYAYCPKCAKEQGHNFMVLFAEV